MRKDLGNERDKNEGWRWKERRNSARGSFVRGVKSRKDVNVGDIKGEGIEGELCYLRVCAMERQKHIYR